MVLCKLIGKSVKLKSGVSLGQKSASLVKHGCYTFSVGFFKVPVKLSLLFQPNSIYIRLLCKKFTKWFTGKEYLTLLGVHSSAGKGRMFNALKKLLQSTLNCLNRIQFLKK